MRAQGLDTPDIRLDAQGRPILDDLRSGVDTSSDEFRRALTECASILTSVGALDLRRDPELQHRGFGPVEVVCEGDVEQRVALVDQLQLGILGKGHVPIGVAPGVGHAGGAPEAAGAGHVAAMGGGAGTIGGHVEILFLQFLVRGK